MVTGRLLRRLNSVGLVVVALALASTPVPQAQGDSLSNRRGGPRDWSHHSIIAPEVRTVRDDRSISEELAVSTHRQVVESRAERRLVATGLRAWVHRLASLVR